MPRYPVSIIAQNPNTGMAHFVAVEEAFGRLPAGSILPREALARTLCITGGRMNATGWRVADNTVSRFCGNCG